MRKLFLGLAAAAVLLVAVVALAATPYPLWLKTLSGDITITNSGVSSIGAGKVVAADLAANSVDSASYVDGSVDEEHLVSPTLDGLNAGRWARVTYDVTGGDSGAVGALGLGVSLPANAIVIQVFFTVLTTFVDGGSGTVAIHCEDANNLITAVDMTGVSADVPTTGVPTDAIAAYEDDIGAACEITATVATAEQTAGKMVIFINYVVSE